MSILEKTHKLCEKFFIFKGGKNSERNYEVWHNKQLLENVLFKFPTQFNKIYDKINDILIRKLKNLCMVI